MAKTKISEWSSTSADNTDISNINIAEGCSPANVNNAIRTVMAQVKDLQAGLSGDTIPVAAGGTGSTTATDARTALSAAKSGANSDITSLSGLTTALSVAQGGTGATTTSAASFALKGANSDITSITGLTTALSAAQGGTGLTSAGTSGNVLTSNGTTWTSSAPATPFSWNVSNVSSTSTISSGTTSYSITSNTIMVLGTAYHPMGSNSGTALGVRIKNSSGTTLFTYTLTGGNENNGGDAGSGMSSRGAWSVAIPSAAIGGTLEFYRASGSSSLTLTINQVVKSA